MLQMLHRFLTELVSNDAIDRGLGSVAPSEGEVLVWDHFDAALSTLTDGDSGIVRLSESTARLCISGLVLNAHFVQLHEISTSRSGSLRLVRELPSRAHVRS